jgi:hypothetical protein
MTAAELQAWRDTAQPGERRIYFTGFLGRTAEFVLKEIVGAAYLAGWLDLTQKRLGDERYQYFITRRRVRDPVERFWRANTEELRNDYHRPRHAVAAAD